MLPQWAKEFLQVAEKLLGMYLCTVTITAEATLLPVGRGHLPGQRRTIRPVQCLLPAASQRTRLQPIAHHLRPLSVFDNLQIPISREWLPEVGVIARGVQFPAGR